MVEKAVLDSGVDSVNINITTGGNRSSRSNHTRAKAVDINRVNGKRVERDREDFASQEDVDALREAFAEHPIIHEHFAPSGSEKYKSSGAEPTSRPDQDAGHNDHLHESGQE